MRKQNGQFGPGNPGRPQGSQNKVTTARKQKINDLLQKIESDHLDSDIAKLTPRDRTNLYATLLEYVIPKLTRTERPLTDLEEMLAMTPEERKEAIRELQSQLKDGN